MPVKFLVKYVKKQFLKTIGQYAVIPIISGLILDITNTQTYNILKKENASWRCIECAKGVFPFSKLDNTNSLTTIQVKILNL